MVSSPVIAAAPVADELNLAPSTSAGEQEFVLAIRRQSYSRALQARLLDEGREAIVLVTGPGYRTLRIVEALMTKADADQYRSDETAIAQWRKIGFELLELTDGKGASWSLKIR